ncbi:pilus assembly protein TadG-related protein [Bradyrhizobium brasilense]|uniref:Pilus assembly protein TadG-related protein n=1 Tax=Bradyrhizobium brasilense TaxID=1419277 RepID=A0ABY8J7A0_9BRAD|nr:pilus assembly protein TadG-related protein [Bradyrhizobium brasilense]WFU61420.1 pilus assembly protein TadG-related protein [Bradyrhizobium brasilense]
MRNMLNCRRGSAAFATVVALIPLIGAVSLGAEAGSWYVTKQHAQNAADAAAYSGALKLACNLAGQTGVTCSDGQTVDYRGKQFAAQNAFCNSGDTSYPGSKCTASLPSGTSQTVTIATLTSWNGNSGDFVQATVTQQQPAYLAKVLGLSTVTMRATGTAQVVVVANPCVLALSDSISFQGSTTVTSPGCGLASNSTAANSVDFTGNGLNVNNVGSISGQGGCKDTGGAQCGKAITYAPPAPDPLSAFNSAMKLLSTSTTNFPSGKCASPPQAYNTGSTCYNLAGGGQAFSFGNQTYNLSGVYFFSGSVTIGGGAIITGTAALILLPGSTLTINGNPKIQLTGPASVSTAQVPAALSSVVSLMSRLVIYDPETSSNVKITGSSTSYFSGITYVPNGDVTYQGSTQSSSCVEVIAKGVTLSGNSSFDNSGCPASVKTQSKYVRMVQ